MVSSFSYFWNSHPRRDQWEFSPFHYDLSKEMGELRLFAWFPNTILLDLPSAAAWCRGVNPSFSLEFTFAPRLTRIFTVSFWPEQSIERAWNFCLIFRYTFFELPADAALCSGVSPKSSLEFRSEPRSMRTFTVSPWPEQRNEKAHTIRFSYNSQHHG